MARQYRQATKAVGAVHGIRNHDNAQRRRAYYREWYARNKEREQEKKLTRFSDYPLREVDQLPRPKDEAEEVCRDELQAMIEGLAIPYARKNALVLSIVRYAHAKQQAQR